MDKYVCAICGYVYDPEVGDPDNGVEPGTAWEDVPEDWVCPLCGVGKDNFEAEYLLEKRNIIKETGHGIVLCFYRKTRHALVNL